MTVHRDFSAKDCPGDYLYKKHVHIAEEVNKRLGSLQNGNANPEVAKENSKTPFLVKVIISDLNYRSVSSMSGKVLGVTGKGTFTITEEKTAEKN